MNPPPTLNKVEIIEKSLSCFQLGLCGLLPVVGIPMAFLSLILYHRVKSSKTGVWNPAHRYLLWGGICARLGLWVFLVIPLATVTYVVISNSL